MKTVIQQAKRKAFTMVELMVAVTIALAIILMLYSIFDKVQTVFVVGQNRALAMDEGRSAMDMLVGDLKLISGAGEGAWIEDGRLIARPKVNFQWDRNSSRGKIIPPPDLNVDENKTLHQHICRFLTHDSAWRMVYYGFNSRKHWALPLKDSPVGSLWVYRSGESVGAEIHKELILHEQLQGMDRQSLVNNPAGLDEPVAFAKLIDGVIHFKIRTVEENEVPGVFRIHAVSDTRFSGLNYPSFIEVELAVLDKKLLKEVQGGMEQQLEDEPDISKRYAARLEHIAQNLDRVYFFKQIVRVPDNKGGL
jgi:prepilin-type N-terminal cleavage/methylation domain-containing protein